MNGHGHPEKWFRAREGLGSLSSKIRHRTCRIAYLGVSVTAQQDGFRPRLHDWICRTFGHNHTAINAGLGGVGSITSVFLMDDLIIKHKPDLCFIECTTGDMDFQTPATEIGPVVEGMVRKLRVIHCEICIIHLYRRDHDFSYPNPVLASYENVADHYGIPSLNLGLYFQEAFSDNGNQPDDLFRDIVHTTPAGAQRYAELIGSCLNDLISLPLTEHETLDATSRPFLHQAPYHDTSIVPVEPMMFMDPAAVSTGFFRLLYPYFEFQSNNILTFRSTEGDLVGCLVVVGKESGIVEVRVRGHSTEYCLWDQWCFYDRLNSLILDRAVDAGQKVQIRLTGKSIGYSICRRQIEDPDQIQKVLRIVGFLVRRPIELNNCIGNAND